MYGGTASSGPLAQFAEQLATSIDKSGGTGGGKQFAENPQNVPSQVQIGGMVGGTRVELVTSAMSTQRSKPLS